MRVELLFVLLLETEEDLDGDRSKGDVSSLCTATETERAESGCVSSWRRKKERTSETTACVVTSKIWAETSLSPTWSFATPSAYAPISVNTLSVRGLTFCRPSETTHTTTLKEGAGREEANNQTLMTLGRADGETHFFHPSEPQVCDLDLSHRCVMFCEQ